jgi:circadian clock protein KaiB
VSARPPRRQKRAAKLRPPGFWQLRLYVNDATPNSIVALENLKKICEAHMKGSYRITVIDLLKHPKLARGDQILAVPTVVRMLPSPMRRIIGTLSDTAQVLVGLDLREAKPPPTP